MKNILTLILFSIVLFSCKKEKDLVESFPIEKTENWMQDLITEFPSKTITLKDLCIPAAHDAGMYEVNNCYAGNACNTQTQDISMENMLKSGIRIFDVRPNFHDGEFWTLHRTHCGGFGCDGIKLTTLLNETNAFLENHNELVVLNLSHFCNTSADDIDFINLLNNTFGDKIYKELSPLDTSFIYTPLKELIPSRNTSGKVVLKMDGLSTSSENRMEGYFAHSLMPTEGQYSNKPVLEEMKADQLGKFNNFSENSVNLFEISWTLTQNNALALNCLQEAENNPPSILDLAYEARANLSSTIDTWLSSGAIYKGKIPNIISVDVANTIVTKECIRISKLNIE